MCLSERLTRGWMSNDSTYALLGGSRCLLCALSGTSGDRPEYATRGPAASRGELTRHSNTFEHGPVLVEHGRTRTISEKTFERHNRRSEGLSSPIDSKTLLSQVARWNSVPLQLSYQHDGNTKNTVKLIRNTRNTDRRMTRPSLPQSGNDGIRGHSSLGLFA